jgi:usherin
LISNGAILFSVYVEGPFLIEFSTKQEKIAYIRENKPLLEYVTYNLLNTTLANTKYGILDRILAYSSYTLRVNASNSRGFLLSNRVKVETLKSGPDDLLEPQLVSASSTSLQVEWFEPILINSDDKIIFYKVNY